MERRYAFVLRICLTESFTTTGVSTGLSTGQKVGRLRGTLQSIHSTEPTHFNSLRQLTHLVEMALQQNDSSVSSSTD